MSLVFVAVSFLALLRQPSALAYEEPFEFWDRVPTMRPLEYLVEPWAGTLQVWSRFAFLVAYPVGEWVTRFLAAAVIGCVAAYLATRREAIPDPRVRIIVAFSLPLLPLPDPGPYFGPLNSQWFLALGVLGVALSPLRRWHYLALVGAGLAGAAPCLAWPIFRDRRMLALLAPSGIQAAVLLSGERHFAGFAISPDFLPVMAALALSLAAAPLPGRTRLAFIYLGLAILVVGAMLTGWAITSNWRYVAVAGVGIVLGLAAWLVRLVSTIQLPFAGPRTSSSA